MLQGDQYYISFALSDRNNPITDEYVSDVEITIGTMSKTMADGVIYKDGAWQFPITQKETFAMSAKSYPVQIRVKFNNGDVVGTNVGNIPVQRSISKEVI